MDDGSFDQNFTWFEWGFVDPSDVRADEGFVQRDSSGYVAAAYPGYGSGPQTWDAAPRTQGAALRPQIGGEDQRWPT